jgi:predicted RNA polymerase sigma factor
MPPEHERTERIRSVLSVLYLIFDDDDTASSDPCLYRSDWTEEAIWLTLMVRGALPDDGEVAGLLALMLLTDASRLARTRPTATWSRSSNRIEADRIRMTSSKASP